MSWHVLQEGPSHDRGVYFRVVEELLDLANVEATSASRSSFFISMFELYNEQVGLQIITGVVCFWQYKQKPTTWWHLCCYLQNHDEVTVIRAP